MALREAHPNNTVIAAAGPNRRAAVLRRLVTRHCGAAHLARFFACIDREYGSVAGYLETDLHFTPAKQEKLRAMYLE